MKARRLLLACFGLILAACGEPAVPSDGDGGPDPICTTAADCSDNVFCNGRERCAPEVDGADARGCLPPSAAACADGETCDEASDTCSAPCAAGEPDADRDGEDSVACGGTDCDDTDPTRYVGALEVCDGDDEDCDPETVGALDADGDGHTDAACCNGTTCGDDCDDAANGVHPGVPDVCNTFDDDCDGAIDEGLSAILEVCNLVDDDCDGTRDEGVCAPCPAGYMGFDGACTDIDECILGIGDCDALATCMNEPGGNRCACPTDYVLAPDGRDCLHDLADLASLVLSSGALSPAFAPSMMMYTLALPHSVASLTLTPSVLAPALATITVQDVAVASGSASAAIPLAVNVPNVVTISVTAESGRVTTYTVIVGRSSQEAYLKASNTGASDFFGLSVALSSDGSTLAVGAPVEDSNATGTAATAAQQADNSAVNSGAVYVFRRTGTSWAQEAYLKASNAGVNDRFGWRVALSSDGSTLAVGADGEDSNVTGTMATAAQQADNSALESGAVYMFRRTGTSWAQEAYLKASNTGADDAFGSEVALSSEGSTLAVGTAFEDSNASGTAATAAEQADDSAYGSGAVYVFRRTGTSWAQEAYLKASNTGASDGFGVSVALSSDDSTLAVGAYGEASNATGTMATAAQQADNSALASGAVYVFRRTGASWAQEAYLKASNTGAGDYFGSSVALSADGSTLAVGAHQEASNAIGTMATAAQQADNSAAESGAVYVFRRTETSWAQEAYLKASNTDRVDWFAWSVALSADGSTLAVSAPHEASNATGTMATAAQQADNSASFSGAVYLFVRTGTSWAQEAYLKASNTGPNDAFGRVALSSDGSTLAVGAHQEASNATGTMATAAQQADNSAPYSGAVYVFR